MNFPSKAWLPHLREASWVAVGQIAAAAGGLLTIKVCTNLLEPADFGQLSAALAIAGLGQVCLFGPIAQSATRFLSFAKERRMTRAFRQALIKLFLLSAVTAFACWPITHFVGLDRVLPISFLLVVLYTLASGIQSIQLAVFNAARWRQWTAGLQIADALLRPTFLLSVGLLAPRSSSSVLTIYILVSALIVLSAARLSANRPFDEEHASGKVASIATDAALFTTMLSFAWPFVVFGVLGAIGSHGERLLLTKFVSWQEVGIYSLMAQLATAPNLMLTSVINQYYLPVLYQSDSLGTKQLGRSYRLYLLFSLAGICAVAIAVATLGRWIIPLLSSSSFLGHEHLFWLLTLSAGIFNLGQQLVLPGMRANRLNIYLPSKLLHSLALLSLAFLLVPEWGIYGMSLASLAAAAVYIFSVLCANFYLARAKSMRSGGDGAQCAS